MSIDKISATNSRTQDPQFHTNWSFPSLWIKKATDGTRTTNNKQRSSNQQYPKTFTLSRFRFIYCNILKLAMSVDKL